MCNVFFNYLKEEDRVLITNEEEKLKVRAVRNGKKVANSDKIGNFKAKLPVTLLVVSRGGKVEVIQVKKSDNGEKELEISQNFKGKIPFRNQKELEKFYVFHCISVNPFRRHLEKLFNEVGGNRKITREELDAFVKEFNQKYRVH